MDKINLLDIINTLPKSIISLSNKLITKTNFNNSYFFNNIISSELISFQLSHPLVFYYSIYYILNPSFTNDITEDDIIRIKNKLVLNIHKNKSFFKYITNKCKKTSLIQFIENTESNEYILQYIAESFNIIIAVLDCEINKIVLYYGGDVLHIYSSIFLFTKYNSRYSILFEDEKYLFKKDEVDWIFNNLDICERCNLEFKKGNTVVIEDHALNKYIKSFEKSRLKYSQSKQQHYNPPSQKKQINVNENNNLINISKSQVYKISLKELQAHATNLNIQIKVATSNGKSKKNKTKLQLYNEICACQS